MEDINRHEGVKLPPPTDRFLVDLSTQWSPHVFSFFSKANDVQFIVVVKLIVRYPEAEPCLDYSHLKASLLLKEKFPFKLDLGSTVQHTTTNG